jgi:NADH-quinone oxidoreductase subunit C
MAGVSASNETVMDFVARLQARFADAAVTVATPRGEVTIDVAPDAWLATALALRDEFGFEQCVDVSGVDYLSYGSDEWDTDVSSEGFSRGVEGKGAGRFKWGESPTALPPCRNAVSPRSRTCCRCSTTAACACAPSPRTTTSRSFPR